MFKKIIDYLFLKEDKEIEEINLENKYIHKIQEIKNKLYYNKNININSRDKFLRNEPYANNMLIEFNISLFGFKGSIIEIYEDHHLGGTMIDDYLNAKYINPLCKIVFDQKLEDEYRNLVKD